MSASDPDLVEQQKEYYRARAGEYDEWPLRQGRYDHGPEFRARWEAEVDQVRRALAAFAPAGSVLELACGTGWWTEQLVRYADRLTVVDASQELLELNRRRVPDVEVRRVRADVFQWQPDGAYDVVFFSFWLSHVPPERFEAFWALVAAALAPGGRVFFIDSLRTELSTARDHRLAEPGEVVTERKLNDGRRFRIVKVFYDPAALQARLEGLGWRATLAATESFFLHGQAQRARGGELRRAPAPPPPAR
ncbi:MAG TPA: class I SAM-dependent methyltransferase [Longimicrobiaceae bacterium]|nr:class I SAM-dependent methyltransferase [Longimicrobiaceae bacterium]